MVFDDPAIHIICMTRAARGLSLTGEHLFPTTAVHVTSG
jgi:hypothetical protein